MTFARSLGDVVALTIGAAADGLAAQLGEYGAVEVHQAHHDLLGDYNPEAWGDVLAGAVRFLAPDFVVATGTDVGNEVLAHAAAVLDAPLAANCLSVESAEPLRGAPRALGRLAGRDRRGRCRRRACSPSPSTPSPRRPRRRRQRRRRGRSTPSSIRRWPAAPSSSGSSATAGVTLATAPVVVGGGRGVGSADGFAALEELAALLGGVVGCSRAVTNNGWRNHTDQVGQTGTRIAPEIYIACGISGAIQHWVGAMASKRILAINTDRRRQHGDQGRLRRHRRPPRGRPGDHRRDPPAARVRITLRYSS